VPAEAGPHWGWAGWEWAKENGCQDCWHLPPRLHGADTQLAHGEVSRNYPL